MKMLYFAWVREQIGVGEEVVEPPAGVSDVGKLIDWLAVGDDAHATAFANRGRLRAAVDGVFTGMEASITGAREVALFPPVTGG